MNTGSSPAMALTSFTPGILDAVSTATTPGAARTASRSTPSNCPAATGAPPTAICSSPSGSRMSSMKVALPATCFGAESCRIERRTTRSRISSERRSGCADTGSLPDADDAREVRGRAGDLGQCTAQQRARRVKPICRACPEVIDRREILCQRGDGRVPFLRLVEMPLDQRLLGCACSFRDCRHPAEGNARARDARAIEAQLERAHDGGDVRVEAFGDLVAAEALIQAELRNPHHADEFACHPVLLAVVEIEIFQRQGAWPVSALQRQCRAERDQCG